MDSEDEDMVLMVHTNLDPRAFSLTESLVSERSGKYIALGSRLGSHNVISKLRQ